MAADKFFFRGEGKEPLKMILRPSMIKFHVKNESEPQELELCTASRAIGAPSWNRSLIKALEGLIPTESIKLAFRTSMDQTAISRGDLVQYNHGPFKVDSLIKELEAYGVVWEKIRHSFLHEVIEYLLFSKLLQAEPDFKLCIPGSYACMGVIDEYQILRKGQVFVRAGGKIITGDVLVYRPPVIHPGDIQMVTAVSKEELMAMIQEPGKEDAATLLKLDNVIVFSRRDNTYRPVPTMLSGA